MPRPNRPNAHINDFDGEIIQRMSYTYKLKVMGEIILYKSNTPGDWAINYWDNSMPPQAGMKLFGNQTDAEEEYQRMVDEVEATRELVIENNQKF